MMPWLSSTMRLPSSLLWMSAKLCFPSENASLSPSHMSLSSCFLSSCIRRILPAVMKRLTMWCLRGICFKWLLFQSRLFSWGDDGKIKSHRQNFCPQVSLKATSNHRGSRIHYVLIHSLIPKCFTSSGAKLQTKHRDKQATYVGAGCIAGNRQLYLSFLVKCQTGKWTTWWEAQPRRIQGTGGILCILPWWLEQHIVSVKRT